ncbi:hypothetical protein IWQ60_006783 [Tieghemiomyces parasiticus]|uniref:Uncharacterized protein n=1 Tax=Tieghemiomyces parasiticus TaxID=78921 RepID=A0A9W8DR76_9FUNG|nr:hypothetical protein IWQ60_006783 [Tieghemiomyces parasiticus]
MAWKSRTVEVASLAFFSICGLWVRQGINALFTFGFAPVFALAMVQLTGCVAMGFIRELKVIQAKAYHQWRESAGGGRPRERTEEGPWSPGAARPSPTAVAPPRPTEKRPRRQKTGDRVAAGPVSAADTEYRPGVNEAALRPTETACLMPEDGSQLRWADPPYVPPSVDPDATDEAFRPGSGELSIAPSSVVAVEATHSLQSVQVVTKPDLPTPHTRHLLNPLDYYLTHVPYLFKGITTGLCGSITTFSSWQLQVFQTAFRVRDDVDINPVASQRTLPPTHFDSLLGAFTHLVVTWCVALVGLKFGHHLAGGWSNANPYRLLYSPQRRRPFPVNPDVKLADRLEPVPFPNAQPHLVRRVLDRLVIVLGLGGWAGVIVGACLSYYWREYSLAACFAPLGTLLRFWLARLNRPSARTEERNRRGLGRISGLLNLRGPSVGVLPWGTFIANIAGTALLGVLFLLGRNVFVIHRAVGGGRESPAFCQLRQAMMDGLCGCLTTVSTLAVEAAVLVPTLTRSYLYTLLSILTAQALLVISAGFYEWFVQPNTRMGRLNCYAA